MELSSIKHIDPAKITDFRTDLFITMLAFESRSTTVARNFERISCRKIALENKNSPREFAYRENAEYLKTQGFEIIGIESEKPDVDSIFEALSMQSFNLVLDCTNMPPLWYYAFFKWFDEKHAGEGKVRMRITYTMAGYVRQPGSGKVREIFDLPGNEIKSANGKKVALILGLGQEKKVSDSIYKLINPDLLYLFYADPPAEKHFVEKVFINNHRLINEAPIRNLVAYPIRNGQAIYQSLVNTILPLRDQYSIVLVPQGPKIFSVVSMLLQMGYPDIRVSYPLIKKPPATDRQSRDEPVVMDILFEGEE